MPDFVCEICGKVYSRTHYNRPSRFCSLKCRGIWTTRSGGIRKGLPVGTVRIRKDNDGNLRAFVKMVMGDRGSQHGWKYRAVLVWEESNGPVPKGFSVHHKDRDTLNDVISNLEILNSFQHMKEHRNEINLAKRLARERNSTRIETVL